jgi:PRTRC genetic system protein B
MKGYVSVGSEVSYELHSALLVYKRSAQHGSEDVFITRHEVKKAESGVPVLGPGETLTMEFVSDLMRAFQGKLDTQVLPGNVLVHSYQRIVWWVPPAIRAMFYVAERSPELGKLSGKRYPQPALLFDVMGSNLRIRALGTSDRPDADTPLFRAPYWNVNDAGLVCLGDTRTPDSVGVATLKQWETAFFESAFTHQNAQKRLTTHHAGFVGLWRELAGKKSFPSRYLASADETLGDYLSR